jgi:hypothetical protein
MVSQAADTLGANNQSNFGIDQYGVVRNGGTDARQFCWYDARALRPVNFRYTTEYLSVHPELDSEKRYNSFIAQEYGEVFPDAVTNQGDLRLVTLDPKTGKESIEILLPDVQQFTPHDLQMYLVAGMKELVVRVEALEAA